jgi:hypothetical protein
MAEASRPAAVVLASLAAPADPALDDLLGAVAAAALRRELARRARRWAAAAAPGQAFEATTPDAALAALAGHPGPSCSSRPTCPASTCGSPRRRWPTWPAGRP